jgi:N-acetylgalactosamine kinase
MDQAISILGEPGYAKLIHFYPKLSCENVRLPDKIVWKDGTSDSLCWVITNSLVESQKAQTAAKNFNKRVVECKLACAILANHFRVSIQEIPHFRALLEVLPDESLESLLDITKTIFKEEAYSLSEIHSLLKIDVIILFWKQDSDIL